MVVKRGSPRKLRKEHGGGELRAVVDETIALFHRLRWVAEQIYGEDGRSTPRRGILRGLVRYGPQTVADLARARFVTRQHVQEVVNALAEVGLVELITNPRHARARLVRPTAKGKQLVHRMDAIDERVLVAIRGDISLRDLESSARTLRAVRQAFEHGTRWRRVLDGASYSKTSTSLAGIVR
jgi:DNA-binding MarR family transcriptional regulator